MIYKYPEENETMPKATRIVCSGCNEDYVLDKAELQALDHFMSKGKLDQASRVLLHQEDVTFWTDFSPAPDVETPSPSESEDYVEPDVSEPVVDEGPQFGHFSTHDASVWGSANPNIAVTPYGPNPFYDPNGGNHLL
jgi:hypothetical protein